MASFDSVLAGLAADGDGFGAHGPEDWLQGRTLYGGMSAALALTPSRRVILSDDGNFPSDLYVAQGLARAMAAFTVSGRPGDRLIVC